jgi:hypothetical protein
MRALILALTLGLGLISLAISPIINYAAGDQPFSIAITAVKTEVQAGSPVEILIRLTNTSNQDVNSSAIYYDGFANDYNYDIRLEGGKKLTQLPRNDKGPVTGSAILGTVKPGKSQETRVDISSQYDMTKVGKYIVQLSKSVPGQSKKAEVKSNKITITVTK